MKYEVQYTLAATEGADFGPGDMAEEIQVFYEDAAQRGGRVIASHTLVFDGEEHVFFVSEFSDSDAAIDSPD